MKNRKRLLLVSLIVVSLIAVPLTLIGACWGGQMLIDRIFASEFRKALPSTAKEIREWRWSEGGLLGQDYVYLLRAKITEQEFLEYVDKFDMTPHTPEREYSPGFVFDWYPHSIHTNRELKWWVPSDSFDGAYVLDGESWWEYAKWENGYIYVVSCNI